MIRGVGLSDVQWIVYFTFTLLSIFGYNLSIERNASNCVYQPGRGSGRRSNPWVLSDCYVKASSVWLNVCGRFANLQEPFYLNK